MLPEKVGHWSLTTLREKLVKIGAKVVHHRRYLTFQQQIYDPVGKTEEPHDPHRLRGILISDPIQLPAVDIVLR